MSGGDVTISYLKRLTNLLAGQDKFNVDITGGTIANVDLVDIDSITLDTPLGVASGGTGGATASVARDNLGLEIGVDVQAYSAGLASIAGLTTAADKGIYTTASNVYATFDLTTAGRALLDDADASAQRTTLGLGTIATQDADNVALTGGLIDNITIGATTPAAAEFTSVTGATGQITTLDVTNIDAIGSGGGALRNQGGTSCASWGGGGGQNFSVTNTLSFGAGGASVTGVLDEDDMASNSATKLATQQSIKSYADSLVTGVTDFISGLIPVVVAQDEKIVIKAPYGGTITNTITQCVSGTATFTFKINTTALGGTANAVSTSEVDEAHASDNVFAAGDDIVITPSSVSSCLRASFTIVFTRDL